MPQKDFDNLESQDTALERFAKILERLFQGEIVKPNELAKEFSVSLRTIQRDLNQRMRHLPIIKVKGGYRIANLVESYDYEKLRKFAIICGIDKLYPSLNNEFLNDLLNENLNYVFSIQQGFEKNPADYATFQLLSVAIVQRQRINFVYKDKKRLLEPYKLLNKLGIWYLVGLEIVENSPSMVKSFTLTKILKLAIREEHFSIDKELLDKIELTKHGWISDNPLVVQLEVDKRASEYFNRKQILSSQKLIKDSKDSFVIECEFAYKDEVFNLVRAWIPYIKILSPRDLRDELIKSLQEYIKS